MDRALSFVLKNHLGPEFATVAAQKEPPMPPIRNFSQLHPDMPLNQESVKAAIAALAPVQAAEVCVLASETLADVLALVKAEVGVQVVAVPAGALPTPGTWGVICKAGTIWSFPA